MAAEPKPLKTKTSRPKSPPRIVLRQARLDDVDAVRALQRRVSPGMEPDTAGAIRARITKLPEGQFIVEYGGEVVGWAATFIIGEAAAFAPHDWQSITGGGFISRHDPD